jgi:hypothetical protein
VADDVAQLKGQLYNIEQTLTGSSQTTGLSRAATTDVAGHYVLLNLPPGPRCESCAIGARRRATGFVEAFNLTNASNYGDYVANVASSLFGRPKTASPKRRLQLGCRFDF